MNTVTRIEARDLCRRARENGESGPVRYNQKTRTYYVGPTGVTRVDEVRSLLNAGDLPYTPSNFLRDFEGDDGYPQTLSVQQDTASGRRNGAFGMRVAAGLLTRKETRKLRSHKRRMKRRGVSE